MDSSPRVDSSFAANMVAQAKKQAAASTAPTLNPSPAMAAPGTRSIVRHLQSGNSANSPVVRAELYKTWFNTLSDGEKVTLMLCSRKHNLVPSDDKALVKKYKDDAVYGNSGPTQSFEKMSNDLEAIVSKKDAQGNPIPAPTQWAVVEILMAPDVKAIYESLVKGVVKPVAMKVLYSDMMITCNTVEEAKAHIEFRMKYLYEAVVVAAVDLGVAGPGSMEDDAGWSALVSKVQSLNWRASDESEIRGSLNNLRFDQILAGLSCPRPHELNHHREIAAAVARGDVATMQYVAKKCNQILIIANRAGMNLQVPEGSITVSFSKDDKFMAVYNTARKYISRYLRAIKNYPLKATLAVPASRKAQSVKSQTFQYTVSSSF